MRAPDQQACQEVSHRAWYRRIDWLASFWVIFLLSLIVEVARSDRPVGTRLLTCGAIAAFIVLDVRTVSTTPIWYETPQLQQRSVRQQLRPVALPLALMALLTAGTSPVLGWLTVYFLPYFGGIILFSTPLGTGLPLVGTACASVILSTVALKAPFGSQWTVVGCTLGTLSIVVSRIGAEVSQRKRTAERELIAASEREEISRDVHDLLGHSLTVLTLKAEVAQRLVEVDPQRAEAELGEIIALSRAALADVRATVTRLRTPDLTGQVEASRTAFAVAQVQAVFQGRAQEVPLPQREILSWALREATTNVLRHAGASQVLVELSPGLLRVTDDGQGALGTEAGHGLSGLRKRVEAVGGSLTLVSPVKDAPLRPTTTSGSGTRLEVVL